MGWHCFSSFSQNIYTSLFVNVVIPSSLFSQVFTSRISQALQHKMFFQSHLSSIKTQNVFQSHLSSIKTQNVFLNSHLSSIKTQKGSFKISEILFFLLPDYWSGQEFVILLSNWVHTPQRQFLLLFIFFFFGVCVDTWNKHIHVACLSPDHQTR